MALQISELYIYPVKGLKGISLKEADALEKGFRHDRRWVLTDQSGLFISQREVPGLALIQTAVVGDFLAISYKESSIMVPLNPERYSGRKAVVQIWNDRLEALEVGQNFNEWFSDILHMKVRLHFMEESSSREVEKEYDAHATVSFADAYPYLLISQASIDYLNEKLEQAVPVNRFRPNIVVAGSTAFEEDTWAKFIAGSARFRAIKPCSRCQVITIDQETGVKGKEPLRTLSDFRQSGNKVKFGMNLVLETPGTVKLGDVISLL